MESGEVNAKRGCGGWMEECGRGAAVEQLTARGMDYQSPQWGAIGILYARSAAKLVSIPAMGGNRTTHGTLNEQDGYQSPRWGGNSWKREHSRDNAISIPAMGAIVAGG